MTQPVNANRTLPQVGRVAVFIDGSNLYHALEENCGRTDLNFSSFAEKLAGERPIYRTYYYNVRQSDRKRPRNARGSKDQERFLNVLYGTEYLEVRLGRTREHQGVTVEKGVDIMLATDLLQYAWKDHYDTGIVVSGDGDFAYAIQTAKDMGKYIEVATFASNQSPEIAQVADKVHTLDTEFLNDLWTTPPEPVKKRRPRRTPRRPRQNTEPNTVD
ncbi:MAG: NYN domain-containing protein [SAR202 cluster bacterium]|nr:NYN domain-containing protein [SAR202 cluster bacterium]|tara:strand:+ start:6186 stop:6833 length:648 start_codon:yes stop_codon:yes gene_type:complete